MFNISNSIKYINSFHSISIDKLSFKQIKDPFHRKILIVALACLVMISISFLICRRLFKATGPIANQNPIINQIASPKLVHSPQTIKAPAEQKDAIFTKQEDDLSRSTPSDSDPAALMVHKNEAPESNLENPQSPPLELVLDRTADESPNEENSEFAQEKDDEQLELVMPNELVVGNIGEVIALDEEKEIIADEKLAESIVQELSQDAFSSKKEYVRIYKEVANDIHDHLTDPQHKICSDYMYLDHLVATDEIHCIEATKWIADLFQERSEALKAHYEEEPATKLDIYRSYSHVDRALRNVSKKMKHDAQLRPTKENWYDSKYFRYLLNLDPKQPYEKAIADYSPGPINFRLQTVKNQASDNQQAWFRIGVITDLTNGWTNFRELKEMIKNEKLKEAKLEQLNKLKKKYSSSARICQSLDYAIKEIEDLSGTLIKRRHILRDQMMILTLAQLMQNKNAISALKNDDTFSFVHLALLNEKTQHPDPSGWAHYENNEMLDMCEIFQEFKGQQVLFEKGLLRPMIDAQGIFHLPKETDTGPDSIIINPIFFNVSVQGNTKNTPVQAEINEQAEQELKFALKADYSHHFFQRAFQLLKKGKSSYDIAFYLAQGLLDKNVPLSFGCLSAKDRTGILGEFLVRYFVKKLIDQLPCDSKEEKKLRGKYYENLYNDVLSTQNNAAKVISQNTGSNIIKTTSLLKSEINPIDPLFRMEYFHAQFKMKETLK